MVTALPKSLTISHEQKYGVLPSNKKYKEVLDEKIKEAKQHLDNKVLQQAHRKTHGGKKFRERKISLDNSINAARKRLEDLMEQRFIYVRHSKEYCEKLNLSNNDLRILHHYVKDDALSFNLEGQNFILAAYPKYDSSGNRKIDPPSFNTQNYWLRAYCKNDGSLAQMCEEEKQRVIPISWHKKLLTKISKSDVVATRAIIDSTIAKIREDNIRYVNNLEQEMKGSGFSDADAKAISDCAIKTLA